MASSESFASELNDFKTEIGAWLVGSFLTTLLIGMLLQQSFGYFRLYPNDPLYMKAWVVATVVLQLLSTAMLIHVSYYYLVTYYLNPVVLTRGVIWTTSGAAYVASINGLLSESFFARRVYMSVSSADGIGLSYYPRYDSPAFDLSPLLRLFFSAQMIMITSACGFYIARATVSLTVHSAVKAADSGVWLAPLATSLLVAGDVQLTSVLVYVLHQTGKTGIRRTSSMVDILIAYAISTGSLICVLNVVTLVLSFVFERSVVFTASTFVCQAVYNLTFVTALNARQLVRSRGELDNTNLDGGIVLGEKRPANPVTPVELVSMAFATGPSQSQLTDGWSGEDRDSSKQETKGELDETDLGVGGVVLGEKGFDFKNDTNEIELPQIAFAVGPSQSQLTGTESSRNCDDSTKAGDIVKSGSDDETLEKRAAPTTATRAVAQDVVELFSLQI
ncbi:hypothetical protein BV20DRAFT_1049302 [Pilatotrama ljubarskyi]|nr:hypothetical protein BV20DRAFT_1049302 [Pilatotrama ljubarskyi]